METQTATTRAMKRAKGSNQLGFRTMSSKVAFGEKKTPITRPNGLIVAAGASGIGVVAIEDSSTTRSGKQVLARTTHGNGRNFSGEILAHRKLMGNRDLQTTATRHWIEEKSGRKRAGMDRKTGGASGAR